MLNQYYEYRKNYYIKTNHCYKLQNKNTNKKNDKKIYITKSMTHLFLVHIVEKSGNLKML